MNKFFTKIAALSVGLAMAIGVGVAVGRRKVDVVKASTTKEISLLFSDIGSTGWANSYETHTVTAKDGTTTLGTITLNKSSKQTQTITTYPVLKNSGMLITFVAESNVTFSSASFSFKQWSNKTQGAELFSSTDGGTNYSTTSETISFSSSTTGSSASLSKSSLSTGTNALKVVFTGTNAIGISSITVAYDVSSTPASYTVTYNGNGLSGTTATGTGASVTIAQNGFTLPTGAEFLRWNTAADGSGNSYTPGTVVTRDLTLYAIWGYKITYKANGGTGEDVIDHTLKTNDYTVAANSFDYTGYKFKNWKTVASGSGTEYAVGATISSPSAAITLFAQWEVDPASYDYLDKAFTGNPSGYTYWSNKNGSSTSAVYAGNSNGTNNSIQLRGSDNSGIISTTSGGTLSRVVVVWESHTDSGRTLDVYGKNEEYKAVSELYGDDKGTKLGSIVCGTSTYLDITGDYAYVGLRMASNAGYLTSISIGWLPVTSFKVQYDLNGGTGTTPSTVEDLSEDDLKSFNVAAVGNDFYKFGYICDGWSSTSNGSKEYNPSTSYDLSEKVAGATVTLYAHWSARTLSGLTAGNTEPTNKTYEVGQSFNSAGLTIHAIFDTNYEDNTDITSQVVWAALEKGTTVQGSYTLDATTVYITISGLTITGPDVVISKNTVPSNVNNTSNSDVRTGYIGSVNYEYFALQTYYSNLEFRNTENGYIANLDSYGKYISNIKVTLSADSFSGNFAMYEGDDAKPVTNAVSASGSGTSRTYNFSGDTEYFNFKKTSTGSWIQIVSIEITLGSAVPEKVVNTVSINDPGTIYDSESKQLTATVTYVGIAKTDSNVTWSKVSGESSITESGMFTASGTTPTVVRATSVLNNSSGEQVSAQFTITPAEKMIKNGHKYFVVSSDNHVFLAKNLDGTYVSSGTTKDKFLSTATLTQDGKYVVAISGVSSSLEDYAWTINEPETSKYQFKNAGDKYFNIWSSSSFYVDTSSENFEFTELNSSGYYSIKSLKSNTYLNVSDNTFETGSNSATTGYKFIEYKEFGTLDHIEVNEELSKTEYFLNDSFSTSDVVVVAYDENGIGQTVTSDYTCTGYNMSSSGEQTVTVTYSGKTDTYSITVIKWRSVLEYTDLSATITWPSSSGDIDGDLATSVATSGNTIFENSSMRLGTGSGGGTLTISTTNDVTSVDVWAKAYNGSYTGATLNVGDQSKEGEFTTDYVEYNFTLSEGTSSLTISTPNSSSRINIQKVVVHSSGYFEIGKTEDCLAIENFIDTYLHWNDYHNDHVTGDNTGDGSCTGYYYGNNNNGAKAGFNALSLRQRQLFSGNSAYAAEWKRLSDWATANGETLNASSQLAQASNVRPSFLSESSNNATIIIVVISLVSLTAVGGYFLLKKKKEQ